MLGEQCRLLANATFCNAPEDCSGSLSCQDFTLAQLCSVESCEDGLGRRHVMVVQQRHCCTQQNGWQCSTWSSSAAPSTSGEIFTSGSHVLLIEGAILSRARVRCACARLTLKVRRLPLTSQSRPERHHVVAERARSNRCSARVLYRRAR